MNCFFNGVGVRTILLLVILPFFSLFAQSPRGAESIKLTDLSSMIELVDEASVESSLRHFLRVSAPTRYHGSIGYRQAKQFIIDAIKEKQLDKSEMLIINDFTPDIDYSVNLMQKDFQQLVVGQIPENSPEYRKWENYTNSFVRLLNGLRADKGANIIWEKKGLQLDAPTLLIVAHYDTVAINKDTMTVLPNLQTQGADNNASGVIAALQLIRVLQKVQLKRTVRVAFLDLEAVGFLGSRELAKNSDVKELAGVINLLMLGHDRLAQDKIKQLGNRRLYGRENSALDAQLANYFINKGDSAEKSIKCSFIGNSFRQGSAFTFWEKSIPGLVFSHDWENDSNEERSFTADDFIETLNLKTFANSIKYITAGVLAWSLDLEP